MNSTSKDKRNREIVESYMKKCDKCGKSYTLGDIARKFGISRQRVLQIVQNSSEPK